MKCEFCYKEIVSGIITVHAPMGKHHYHLDCFVKYFHGEEYKEPQTLTLDEVKLAANK